MAAPSAASVGATGMLVADFLLSMRAQNIANSGVNGAKAIAAAVVDNPYITLRAPGSPTEGGNELPTGLQAGLGARVAATTRIMTDGVPQQTDGTYDLAIIGKGYFQVQTEDGVAYTRDGHFSLDADRQIVDLEGRVLQPGLTVPQNALSVNISSSGEVSAQISGQVDPAVIGTIELASFPNPAGLEAIGGNLYIETSPSGGPVTGAPNQDGFGELMQGYLESSNISMPIEMMGLLQAQRLYEASATAVKAGNRTDEIDAQLAA